MMGTQASLYPLPFRIAYASLKRGTKRFNRCLPLQYESGNYNNTSAVPVSAKMSPLQQ